MAGTKDRIKLKSERQGPNNSGHWDRGFRILFQTDEKKEIGLTELK